MSEQQDSLVNMTTRFLRDVQARASRMVSGEEDAAAEELLGLLALVVGGVMVIRRNKAGTAVLGQAVRHLTRAAAK